MPRLPTYQPNSVQPASVTNARFQAAPDPGNIGASVARFGGAIADYAVEQDKMNLLFDDTGSRKKAIELDEQAKLWVNEFKTLEGLGAHEARGKLESDLKALHTDFRGQMTSPRMKSMFEARTEVLMSNARVEIAGHATVQLKVEADRTQKSQLFTFGESAAASFDNPDGITDAIEAGQTVLDAQQELHDWSDDSRRAAGFDYESSVHRAVTLRQAAEGNNTAAIVYFEAHLDKLNAADELALSNMLKPLIQGREDEDDLNAIMTGPQTAPGTLPSTFTYQSPVAGTETSQFGALRGKGKSHNGLDIAAPLGSGINPIAPGRVISVSSDGNSGNFVVIDHGGGRTSSYSHMSKQSVKVGDQVASTSTIGFVGVTGNASGPHVHLVVKENGVAVDPKKYIGRSGQSSAGPHTYDKGQVYEAIEARGKTLGWEPEKTQRIMELADEKIRREDDIIRRSESEADRAASKVVADMGGGFTSIAQLPLEVRDNLSGDALREYLGVAARNAAPREVKANGDVQRAINLVRTSGETGAEEFKAMNLGKYQGLMTDAEFDTLVIKQSEMRNQRPAAFNPQQGIQNAINWGVKYKGLEIDKDDFPAIVDIMEAELRKHYQNTKKPPTDVEYEAALRSATRGIKTKNTGVLWGLGPSSEGSIPRYALGTENIPAKILDTVRAYAAAVYGDNPTDEQIAKTFRLGKGRHW